MKKGSLLKFFICLAILGLTAPAYAWSPKMSINDNIWAQLGVLGQFIFEAKEDNAGNFTDTTMAGDKWSNSFHVRRFRILLQGSVDKHIQFLIDTDVPNAGKRADAGAAMPPGEEFILNDGFVDFNIFPELRIEVGRILVPFSYENKQSAAQLLGLDYNLNALKIPSLAKDLAAWRDDGVEIRGILSTKEGFLAGKSIDYRVGAFTGQRDNSKNPDDNLRYTGHVMVNLASNQPGWFYSNNPLCPKLVIRSIGFGFDTQKDGYEKDKSYNAWVIDAQIEQPVSDGRSISASGGYYNWKHANNDFTGKTMFLQVGFLATPNIQPIVRLEHQDPDEGKTLDTYHIGFNYLINNHNANIKADYAINDRMVGADNKKKDAFRIQVQFLF